MLQALGLLESDLPEIQKMLDVGKDLETIVDHFRAVGKRRSSQLMAQR